MADETTSANQTENTSIAAKALQGIAAARTGLSVGIFGLAATNGALTSSTPTTTTTTTTNSTEIITSAASSAADENQRLALLRANGLIEIAMGITILAFMFYYIFEKHRPKTVPVPITGSQVSEAISKAGNDALAADDSTPLRSTVTALKNAANIAVNTNPVEVCSAVRDIVSATRDAGVTANNKARTDADTARAAFLVERGRIALPVIPAFAAPGAIAAANADNGALNNAIQQFNINVPAAPVGAGAGGIVDPLQPIRVLITNFEATAHQIQISQRAPAGNEGLYDLPNITDWQKRCADAVRDANAAIPAAERNVDGAGVVVGGPNTAAVAQMNTLKAAIDTFVNSAGAANTAVVAAIAAADPIAPVRAHLIRALTAINNAGNAVGLPTPANLKYADAILNAQAEFEAAIAAATQAVPAAELAPGAAAHPNIDAVHAIDAIRPSLEAYIAAAREVNSSTDALAEAKRVWEELFDISKPHALAIARADSLPALDTAIANLIAYHATPATPLSTHGKAALCDIATAIKNAAHAALRQPPNQISAASVVTTVETVANASFAIANIINGHEPTRNAALAIADKARKVADAGQTKVDGGVKEPTRFTASSLIQLLLGVACLLAGAFLLVASNPNYTKTNNDSGYYLGAIGIALSAVEQAAGHALAIFDNSTRRSNRVAPTATATATATADAV